MELVINETAEFDRLTSLIAVVHDDIDLDAEFVEWLLSAWIMDDQGNAGVAIQLAAAAEFGCETSSIRPNGISDTTEAQAILRWLQSSERRGEMIVYRGTSGREGLPLESWTQSREIAEFYAIRNGGKVIERIVGADNILCTWRSGFGLECAEEVIVINRHGWDTATHNF